MKAFRTALLSTLLLVPVGCAGPSGSFIAATTTTSTTITTMPAGPVRVEGTIDTPDGRTRTYRTYVPAGVGTDDVPLVIALHGGTGSGAKFERSSGLDVQADLHGFVVVYPDGVGNGPDETGMRTWNARLCCGSAARKGVDDVTFIDLLIDRMEADHHIDPDRVFVVGHSNGGFMAYRLACELSDRITAVGLQAGGLGVETCEPDQPVSLLHLHGRDDTNVPIEGGLGTGISRVGFPPLEDSLATVTAAMGCADPPDTAMEGIVERRTWDDCDGGVTVEVQVVDGHDHSWMKDEFDSAATIVEFLLAQ